MSKQKSKSIDQGKLPDLDERGRFWQRVLRLQDWDIIYEWKRYHELHGKDAEATCKIAHRHQMAWVSVRHPDDCPPEHTPDMDVDLTIVHELLHITLHPLSDKPDTDTEEVIVEVLSRQIVKLWRGEFK